MHAVGALVCSGAAVPGSDALSSILLCVPSTGFMNAAMLTPAVLVLPWGFSFVQVRYMERDAAELQAAGAGAQDRDIMQDIFLQVRRQVHS
jgi:hypothetical protein